MTPIDTAPWPAYRYVWRLHRFRPKRQLVNLAGVLLGWGTDVLPGVAAKIVFDRLPSLHHGSSLGWLWWPIAIVVAKSLSTVIVSFTLQRTNGAFAYANAAMLQRNMLRRILELPGGRALPSSPGEAVSRFRDDTEAVVWYPIGLNNVIGSTFVGAIAVTLMLRISVVVTLGVFLPIALVVVIVEGARTRIIAYRRANQMRTSELTGFLGDIFTAVQTVQVGNAQARVVQRFSELNARRRHAAVRDAMVDEILKGAFWIVNLGTAVVLVFAGRSLANGSFSVGDLALFVYFLNVAQEITRDYGGGWAGYKQQSVSFGRMDALLAGAPPETLVSHDEIHERGPLPPDERLPEVEPLRELRVEGLSFAFDSSGIDGASFTLPRGSFTVVTGRVGSGKSTLLRSVLGLLPADGTITWNGTLVEDPSSFLVPPRTAYTPQVPHLFSETLGDNILLGIEGDIDEAVRLAVLDEDVAEMADGLATPIGSRGVRLSGGQLQRAAAARMFVRRPELLVCDDLSSALDVETEAALWDRVLADRTRTVLAVSHRRAALRRADQVIVLQSGRVVDVGPLTEVLPRCEELQALWRDAVLASDA